MDIRKIDLWKKFTSHYKKLGFTRYVNDTHEFSSLRNDSLDYSLTISARDGSILICVSKRISDNYKVELNLHRVDFSTDHKTLIKFINDFLLVNNAIKNVASTATK
jgi:hypothetical protein